MSCKKRKGIERTNDLNENIDLVVEWELARIKSRKAGALLIWDEKKVR